MEATKKQAEAIFNKNEILLRKMDAKLKTQNTEELKDIIAKMYLDFSSEADIILSCAMRALEKRIPSPEFIAFLDSL